MLLMWTGMLASVPGGRGRDEGKDIYEGLQLDAWVNGSVCFKKGAPMKL